ncbi:hypothetical protein AGMMS49942_19770 [Spirochaetia bacterium]|nr:hypothetical protein AGMMS49942_19770 [Spirochaetia bacterium]
MKDEMMLYTDPDEVIAEVDTWAWLVGNLPNENQVCDDNVYGLYLIGNMIAQNVKTAIKDLRKEINTLRDTKGAINENT